MMVALKALYKALPAPLSRLMDFFIRGQRVRLDVSSKCQLKCPGCPTGTGELEKTAGNGIVSFEQFDRFIETNKKVSEIEISNWGEVFLNPELDRILKRAHEKNLTLTIGNGANLNHASPAVLEALVRYGVVREITCSIDGATQETYEQYRVRGKLDQVLGHIDEINRLKERFGTPYPRLIWQYVAFGHNEHEIDLASRMARDRNMEFYLKLSWGNLYGRDVSPVRKKELVRKFSKAESADREEFEEKKGFHYIEPTCEQLWTSPQIHSDGRLLGCVINYRYDFGNVFDSRLDEVLQGPRLERARKMLTGKLEPQLDIACTQCPVYRTRQKYQRWVNPDALDQKPPQSRMVNWVLRRLSLD